MLIATVREKTEDWKKIVESEINSASDWLNSLITYLQPIRV